MDFLFPHINFIKKYYLIQYEVTVLDLELRIPHLSYQFLDTGLQEIKYTRI
jgi:hypothetical protein